MSRDITDSINAYLAQYEADKVPKGWYTTAELARHWKLQIRQAQNRTQRFVDAGECEKRTYRVKSKTTIRPVHHFGFKAGAAKVLGLTVRS